MVPGSWAVPAPLAAHLQGAARPVPAPVDGLFLIDTGASHTCIGEEVTVALSLPRTSFGMTYGAGGLHRNPEYLASLMLRLPLTGGGHGTINREQTALAVPELNRQFEIAQANSALPALAGSTPWRLIGLIGRDLLQNMSFELHGPTGGFSLMVHT